MIVIDPGMDFPVGHHLSASTEFAFAAEELGFACTFLVSRACNPADFRSLGCDVVPTFTIGPYLLSASKEAELAAYLAAGDALAAEYATCLIPDGACVLMHTASPWHLRALARRLRTVQDVRVAIGLMVSTSYWAKDRETVNRLEAISERALAELAEHGCVVYSETGDVDGVGTLVMPVSRRTLSEIESLEASPPPKRNPGHLAFGYFGQPRPHKGFDRILDVLGRGVLDNEPGRSFTFFLPAEWSTLSDRINAMSPRAHAVPVCRDNRRYLSDMMSIDVVLCFYDPDYYARQMSGIVTEAAVLGKPSLVVKGTGLQRFLDRYAPGSYCAIDFDDDALTAALTQPRDIWRQKRSKAEASKNLVRELKGARRFFTIAFGL